MGVDSDRKPLYLPIDQIPSLPRNEIILGLLGVSAFAVSGSSGFVRLIQGDRGKEVYDMIGDGNTFLDYVKRDMRMIRCGVNVRSEDARVFYHPGLVVKESGRSAEQIERSARSLARNLREVMENNGERYTPRRLVSMLKRFIKISDPYVNIALQAAKGRF